MEAKSCVVGRGHFVSKSDRDDEARLLDETWPPGIYSGIRIIYRSFLRLSLT